MQIKFMQLSRLSELSELSLSKFTQISLFVVLNLQNSFNWHIH